MEVQGNFDVTNIISTGRRLNQGANAENISTLRNLTINDYYWLRITNSSTQDIVMPDATTLPLGWKVVVDVPTASGASVNVKSYHVSAPVLLKNILTNRAYEFTLVDKSDSAGLWHLNYLEEADLIAVPRFESTFNGTTDWGTASAGFYTITITAGTHGRGTMPQVMVQKLTGSDYYTVFVDRCLVLANGNTSIRVPDDPDSRFAGRLLFI